MWREVHSLAFGSDNTTQYGGGGVVQFGHFNLERANKNATEDRSHEDKRERSGR